MPRSFKVTSLLLISLFTANLSQAINNKKICPVYFLENIRFDEVSPHELEKKNWLIGPSEGRTIGIRLRRVISHPEDNTDWLMAHIASYWFLMERMLITHFDKGSQQKTFAFKLAVISQFLEYNLDLSYTLTNRFGDGRTYITGAYSLEEIARYLPDTDTNTSIPNEHWEHYAILAKALTTSNFRLKQAHLESLLHTSLIKPRVALMHDQGIRCSQGDTSACLEAEDYARWLSHKDLFPLQYLPADTPYASWRWRYLYPNDLPRAGWIKGATSQAPAPPYFSIPTPVIFSWLVNEKKTKLKPDHCHRLQISDSADYGGLFKLEEVRDHRHVPLKANRCVTVLLECQDTPVMATFEDQGRLYMTLQKTLTVVAVVLVIYLVWSQGPGAIIDLLQELQNVW